MAIVNVCPKIPDDWRGSLQQAARILGMATSTLYLKAELGRRNGGIDWKPGKRGKVVTGREIKRFWLNYT